MVTQLIHHKEIQNAEKENQVNKKIFKYVLRGVIPI